MTTTSKPTANMFVRLWLEWLNWTDRDIAECWPFMMPASTSGMIWLLLLLPNLLFFWIHIPEMARLAVLGVTATASFICLSVWVWRVARHWTVVRRGVQPTK